jgi:hypothetical protein
MLVVKVLDFLVHRYQALQLADGMVAVQDMWVVHHRIPEVLAVAVELISV